MHSLLTPLSSACISEFWRIVCECAYDLGKRPMLIGKEHNLPCFVLLDFLGTGDLGLGDLVIASYPPLQADLIWWDDFYRHAVPPT